MSVNDDCPTFPQGDDSQCSVLVPPFVASTPLSQDSADPYGTSKLGSASSEFPSLPGYQIRAELGRGGMGIVYQAEQLTLKRVVALKMIRPALAGGEIHERFHREAKAVARLQHPHIVQIYEVGEHNGCPFLSLEYVAGGNLARHLDGRPMDPRRAAQLIRPLAQAIHYAHDKGIVHRDLKPSNILLQKNVTTNHTNNTNKKNSNEKLSGQYFALSSSDSSDSCDSWWLSVPKIADFGLAKHVDDDVRLSLDGAVLGTPNYMAPEQAGGRAAAIDPRTDVHALGAILYELLTGRPPFLGVTTEETVRQVCEQEPVPPRRLVGPLPRDLDTICLKCLQKDPARRYPSAAALDQDLRRFLEGEVIQARPISRLESAARWARRHPAVATLLSCLLLAAATAALAVPFHIRLLNAQVRAGTEEIHRLNRENLRERVGWLLQQGRKARERKEWTEARMRFTQILDNLDANPQWLDEVLGREREEARDELAAVDRQLAADKAKAERQRNYRELFHWRDEAFFLLNRDLFTPSASSPRESIAAAQRGLSLFGMAGAAPGEPDLNGYDSAEREELRGGLFELLLIEAEALVREDEDAEQAVVLLDRAARLNVDASIVHARRARYLRKRGRIDEAEREQRSADSVAPKTALGWFLRGHDLGLDEVHRAAAIQAFDDALRLRGDLFWAHFFRALAYQKQGQPAEARASLTVCAARRDGFAWNYLLRGLVLMELGDFPAAEADFNKAESLSLDSAARYALYLNRGTLRLKEKKSAGAMRQFEKAVEEKPQLYQAHANLAEACGQLDQLDEAVRRLSEAIRLEPNHAGLYRARALLEQRRGRPAAALTDLDEAIRLVPRERPSLELARYHFERGAILFLSDRFRPALQALDDSLAVWPSSSGTPNRNRGMSASQTERDRLSANTQLLRAQALLKLNDYKNARAAFDAYLIVGPATANVWRQRAAVDLKLQDYQAVLEDCSRALGLEQDADSFCLRGCAYLHFHVPKSAVRDFEEALRLRPEHAEARVWRGLARIEIGDLRRGVEDARQAVKQNPRSPAVTLCAARVFARASAVERDSLEHSAEALRLLRQAIELIPTLEEQRAFWSSKIERDGALSPIRGKAAFQALERRFGQARR